MTPITIAQTRIFRIQLERIASGRAGDKLKRLFRKLIHSLSFPQVIKIATGAVH